MLTPPVQLTTSPGPSSAGPSSTGQSSVTASASETAVPETAASETAVPETGRPRAGRVSATAGSTAEGARAVITAEPVRLGITLTSLTRSCHGPRGQAAIPYTKIIAKCSDIFRNIEIVFKKGSSTT